MVDVRGTEYTLKFGLNALRRLEAWNIKFGDLPKNASEGWHQLRCQVAASACTIQDGKLQYAGLTPEGIEEIYNGDPDLWEMNALRSAVQLAIDFLPPLGENSQHSTA